MDDKKRTLGISPGDAWTWLAPDGHRYVLEILEDTEPDNPRGWGPATTVVAPYADRYFEDLGMDCGEYWARLVGKDEDKLLAAAKAYGPKDQSGLSDGDLVDGLLARVKEDPMGDLACEILKNDLVALPLYAYDHGGISFSVEHVYPYNDRWDAWMAGTVVCTKEAALRAGCDPSDWRLQAKQIIMGEIETYSYKINSKCFEIFPAN